MPRYGLTVLWSEEDQAFVATCLDFPGLSAFGETPEEAFAEGMLCLQLFEESLLASGDPLPEATNVSEFSGQTRIRIPKTLHRALTQKANIEGVSLNTWIVMLLSERNSTSEFMDEVCSRIAIVEQTIKVRPTESKEQIRTHKPRLKRTSHEVA
jgi:predicted RNase H-like HicB family nuclease